MRGKVADPGMTYEILGRIQATSSSSGVIPKITCTSTTDGTANATVSVVGAQEAWITWVGDTDYSLDAGDVAHGFSFQGADPHAKLVTIISTAAPSNVNATTPSSGYTSLLSQHVTDYQKVFGGFELSLGQKPDFNTPTNELYIAYTTDVGDPYVEWLLFNFGRYLLVGSARGTLPANLQGKWADGTSNPWSAGEHI